MECFSLSLVDEELHFLLSKGTEGGSFILSGIRKCYLIYDYISLLLLHLLLYIKHCCSPFSKCYISSAIHTDPEQNSNMKHRFSHFLFYILDNKLLFTLYSCACILSIKL